MSTTVVNRKTYSACGSQVVDIGRPGPYGNRFIIGRDGTREEVVEKHREYILGAIEEKPKLIETLRRELRGKVLLCHCAPEICHGDTLAELVDASEDEFRAIMVGYEMRHPRRGPVTP